MNKLMLIASLLFVVAPAEAGMIEATLLDHVMTVTQFTSGETKLALVDSVVQIGSKEGRSILDLQAGFSGNVKPEPDQVQAANLVGGAFLKVSTLISGQVNFPSHWEFLNSLEHGAYAMYDFRDKDTDFGYQVGLAFDLAPKN